jgi:hypothetical protein
MTGGGGGGDGWRRSSACNTNSCVEVWIKSSYCTNGNCVEVGTCDIGDGHVHVHVRDSKDPNGPRLTFTPVEWAAFLAGVRGGEFDLAEGAIR